MSGGVFTLERVRSAAAAEAAHPPTLLPSRLLERAVADRLLTDSVDGDSSFVRYLVGRLSNGIEIGPAPILLASKSHKGRRPVHVLSFLQRVLYRVLVDSIGLGDELGIRSAEAFEEFRVGPLAHDEYAYVAMTDVVGYYRYVDHSMLADELVSLTGATPDVERLMSFLDGIVGEQRSLPQNLGPSHVLADAYLDRGLRGVLRRGHPAWSFSDDILLAGADWRDINRALEQLGEALDRLGLVLNEEKTRYFHQERYAAWIAQPDYALASVSGAADLMAVLNEYDPDDPPDPEERRAGLVAKVPAAIRLLSRSIALLTAKPGLSRLNATVNRRVITGCLRTLKASGSPEGLSYVRDLLAYEPSLTPAVARYLSSVATGSETVFELLAALLANDDRYLSEWQVAWLLEPAVAMVHELPELGDLEPVLSSLLDEDSDHVWGRAALALAQRDAIDLKRITQRLESVPEALRPDLVAAVAWRSYDRSSREVRDLCKDRLHGVIVDSIISE